MAEIIWTEPALCDLDSIADYIALDKPAAAKAWVERVFRHVEQLAQQPESGSVPKELRDARYRQIVEHPARSSPPAERAAAPESPVQGLKGS